MPSAIPSILLAAATPSISSPLIVLRAPATGRTESPRLNPRAGQGGSAGLSGTMGALETLNCEARQRAAAVIDMENNWWGTADPEAIAQEIGNLRDDIVAAFEALEAIGADSIEEHMRYNGISVIHGGENSLRFTPYFAMTSEEVDLLVEATREAILNGPVKQSEDEAAAA